FEACKALGEKTIIGVLVSAEVHRRTLLSDGAEAEAERDKMARLKRLRLEREASSKLAAPSEAVLKSAELPREPSVKGFGNDFKKTRGRLNRRDLESTPKTLSEWLTQQKRDGGRY